MNWTKLLLVLVAAGLTACGDDAVVVPDPDSGTPTEDLGKPDIVTPDVVTPEDMVMPQDMTQPPDDMVTPEDMPPVDVTPPEDTPPADTAPMCATGEQMCGGGCVDTMTSTLHCGMCDRACGPSESCRAGSCQPTTTCMGSETACGGGCVNTMTDSSHCGMCNNACATGQRCMAATCVAERMCPTGQSDCTPTAPAMTCINTQTSTMHCGSCGNACASGESCAMGICQPAACPSGQTRCTAMGVATCVNTMTDNGNCGACGTACPMGEACMGGTCRSTCAAPRLTCTVGGVSACVEVQTDNANCGTCGTACMAGQTCQAGRCACPTGRTACGTACVDAQTDEANCGRCGNACGAGQTCLRGVCACPTGRTLCGTTCVDVQTDVANCGRCATRCTSPATCSAGVCNSLCGAGTTSCGGRCVAVTSFLTDSGNCGRCGNRCVSGTSCVVGTCRPVNDNRASATTLVPNPLREVTLAGNTENSTHDGPTVPCGCTSGGNVWYRVSIPTEGVVYIDTAGSSYDTSLFITNSTGVAVPGQAASGFASAGLCNDDSSCGTGGGFTSGLQSRTAGLLAAGVYYVAVGGCGTGAFTIRLQYVPRTVARAFANGRLTGTGNTGTQTLGVGSVTASTTCGGSSGAELASWFLTCGATATRQLFSTCRSDPSAFFIRRQTSSSSPSYDPVMYVRSAQTGAQVSCNDDGSGTGVDCRGVIPILPGANVGALDTLQRGSRLSALSTPRGLGVVFVDTLGESNAMRYNMRFEAP